MIVARVCHVRHSNERLWWRSTDDALFRCVVIRHLNTTHSSFCSAAAAAAATGQVSEMSQDVQITWSLSLEPRCCPWLRASASARRTLLLCGDRKLTRHRPITALPPPSLHVALFFVNYTRFQSCIRCCVNKWPSIHPQLIISLYITVTSPACILRSVNKS